MRHKKRGRKFHRKKDQRMALLKGLAENLILHGKIKTTLPKAKELKMFIEKKIAKAKKEDLTTYRYLRKYFSETATKKLIKEIASSLKEKRGGYTRIIKTNERLRDNAKMAIIEIIK